VERTASVTGRRMRIERRADRWFAVSGCDALVLSVCDSPGGTLAGALLAHLAYGAIVGGFAAGS
jgi:hypothetical protein